MSATDRSTSPIDHEAHEALQHAGIRTWIRDNLGGDVEDITRLERWRPQWKVSYRIGDDVSAVLVRGNRPIAAPGDLHFEMEVMQVLEANGIKVPHIYGWCDDPMAFVMDWVETEDRAPGMLHTAIENPSTLSDERWQAMLNYMSHLAEVHKIPVSEFAHIKRLANPPKTPQEIALHATERMYNNGVKTGNNDTAFEFIQHWLRRNIPMHRTEARFIAGDAGQFMSAGSEVLALLDFEIANIGDIHWDLACFRGRHPYENMGDIPALYREYERVTGEPVDLRIVGFHTVAFLQLSAIAAKFFMMPEARGGNWIEGVLEYGSITRRALEAIAELEGVQLDYALELPAKDKNWLEDTGLRKLLIDIDQLPTSTAFQPWERELMHSIPAFLLNYSYYRQWFEQTCVAEINQVTGGQFESLSVADQAMMDWIADNDPARDATLVQLMHRRILRLSMIMAGSNPDDTNPLFHKLDPILS